MQVKSILTLLSEHLEGTIGPEDKADLDKWLGASQENRTFFQEINDPEKMLASLRKMAQYDETRIWEKVGKGRMDADGSVDADRPQSHNAAGGKTISISNRRWIRYAAAIVVLLGAGAYLLYQVKTRHPAETRVLADVPPGGNKAVLTLANGQKVILDSLANGVIAQQGNASVDKIGGSGLAYKVSDEGKGPLLFNTLTTPRGGQYQVTLPDGTRVWLNASSSIRYPTAFTGKNRAVDITGEAYFEVAPNPGMPFTVTARHQLIEEIGTHFDVNAYTDETELKTTLLEGAVRVGGIVLQPGEQAIQQPDAPDARVITVDTAAAVAWKNGLFDFNQVGIAELMRQLARWYDVEVVYEGRKIPDEHFYGAIGRDLTLAQVLAGLEQTHVHFRIEGRTIKVLP